MDFNKVTKAELQTAYIALQSENTKAHQAAKEAIEIANYFAANLSAIENLLVSAPFLNKDGKFFKKILWVLTNFSSIKELIEQIFLLIKTWRERITEAQKNQQLANGTTVTAG